MVSSEQVVKPRSRRAVVKPEVLHFVHFVRVPATRVILYELGQLKMGVVLIKWAWPKNSLQPHRCNNPRSAPDQPDWTSPKWRSWFITTWEKV